MRIFAAICVACFLGSVAFGQSRFQWEFGLGAGVPVTKPLSRTIASSSGVSSYSIPRTLIVGPMFGVVLFDRLQVEVQGLYRPYRRTESHLSSSSPNSSTNQIHGSFWQFPIVARYYIFQHRSLRPYGGGGVLLANALYATSDQRYVTTTGAVFDNSARFRRWDSFPGYIINAGLELRDPPIPGRFTIRPEFRYTHQAIPGAHANQLEFFIGFSAKAPFD
jgi:hypothetical protein